jgi:integrase
VLVAQTTGARACTTTWFWHSRSHCGTASVAGQSTCGGSDAAYVTYKFVLTQHVLPALGSVPLAKLEPQHVQRLQRDMASKGLSLATIRLARAVLSGGLQQAVKWGLLSRSVVTLVDAPVGESAQPDVLSPEQAAALLEAAHGDSYERLYRFLLATGLRIGEALGLRWSDIDPDYRMLRVRQQLVVLPGKPKSFGDPKSKSGRRVVPIIPMAADALHAQRAHVLRQRLRAAEMWQERDLVFCNHVGNPVDAREVRLHLHALAARVGLPATVTPHTLRHSAATYLLAAGVPDRVVMEILGHSSLAMTSRYEHVLSDMLSSAGDKLARFLAAASV